MRKVKRVAKEACAGAARGSARGRRRRTGSEKRARPAPTPSLELVVSATASWRPWRIEAEPRSVSFSRNAARPKAVASGLEAEAGWRGTARRTARRRRAAAEQDRGMAAL